MTIVAFGGRIASGKSAISRAVAAQLGVPRVSFGDAVRAESERRGLHQDRETLQSLGDELIAAGWDVFCELVVSLASWDPTGLLVVDGVRHLGAIDALNRLAGPPATIVVFVDVDFRRRLAWQAARGVTEEDALAADAHPNEAEVDHVKNAADLVLGNNGSIEQATNEVVSALVERGVVPRG